METEARAVDKEQQEEDLAAAVAEPELRAPRARKGAQYKWREIGETGDGEEFDTSTGEATGNKADGFFAWQVRERLGAKS